MVIVLIQFFSFEYLSLNFESYSFVIILATLVEKEVHQPKGTPMFVPTPIKDSDVPTVNPLRSTKISNIVLKKLFSFF